MTWTSNVPLGNQTVAKNRPPLQGNTNYIENNMQKDHTWNNNVPGYDNGRHTKITLQNLSSEPPALPSGADGVYYMYNGKPKFYDGTDIYVLQDPQTLQNWYPFSGVISLAGAASAPVPIAISGSGFTQISGNVCGSLTCVDAANSATNTTVEFFQLNTVTPNNFVNTTVNNANGKISVNWNAGVLIVTNVQVFVAVNIVVTGYFYTIP